MISQRYSKNPTIQTIYYFFLQLPSFIGEEAFNSCNLTSITINDSVTSIKANVFIHTYNLRGIYCNATTPPLIDGSTFNGTSKYMKIYVPSASIEAYKTASGWNKYASYMVAYDFEKGEVVE